MQSTTLVIMAAGIGSRFGGGIKQLEAVGPGGEIIMDYSIYDALEAGFDKIVFIIRKDLEKDFKEIIGRRIEKTAPVFYGFQELHDLPKGFKPGQRTKPWGTGQAVLAAKDLVEEPFLVINADDYYGKEVFQKLRRYLAQDMDLEAPVYDMCMGGFILSNTLSDNGGVTRGVCVLNPDGSLKDVTETYDIRRSGQALLASDENGNQVTLNPQQHVSMNMWGFPPSFMKALSEGFPEFLRNLKPDDLKSEYLLPRIVDQMIRANKARVTVLETQDKWFGVTYKEDKATVVQAIQRLIEAGAYPEKLF